MVYGLLPHFVSTFQVISAFNASRTFIKDKSESCLQQCSLFMWLYDVWYTYPMCWEVESQWFALQCLCLNLGTIFLLKFTWKHLWKNKLRWKVDSIVIRYVKWGNNFDKFLVRICCSPLWSSVHSTFCGGSVENFTFCLFCTGLGNKIMNPNCKDFIMSYLSHVPYIYRCWLEWCYSITWQC